MTTTQNREAEIVADPNIPVVTITREFDAPKERVFRAWEDPELVKLWMGPRSTDMDIQLWDCRTGGSYRYAASHGGEEVARFYGSFHESRPGERLVQTWTWEGLPDTVCLETMTFEPLENGRSRIISVTVLDSMEAQAGMMASGMESGINEGYEQLDELLASGQA
jgi:uncharacterized protein YndB with AHSA1/START domain